MRVNSSTPAIDPSSTQDLNLLCAAAAQLSAPVHLRLRLDVAKIAETLEHAQKKRENRLAAVDKLLQAGSALSTLGRSIMDRGDAALTVDDCVNVAFALKVSQVLSKVPDLPKDTDERVKAFAGAVKTFAHDATMHAFSLLRDTRDELQADSTWLGKGPVEWRDLQTLLENPVALAMEQPGFPVFEVLASNPISSGKSGRR